MRLPGSTSDRRWGGWPAIAVVCGGLVIGLALGLMIIKPPPIAGEITTTQAGTPSGLFATLPPNSVPAYASGDAAPLVGRLAPDFTLPTLDGGEITLSDLRGSPVLINFWASWCPPCRLEMPELVRIYEAHKDEDFVILGVDLTFQDAIADVEAFVEEFNMTFPVLLDKTGEVGRAYRLLGIPMSVFVDRQGIIRRIHIGLMTGDQLEEFTAEILE